MLLSKAITQGMPSALKMAKTLIDNPMIISLTPPQFGVSLEVESYAKRGTAEVSQRPVIVPGTGSKQYINDNIAPQPLEWSLSGYIPGNGLIEKTCLFTPVVQANTEFLWLAFTKGARIVYKDMNQRVYTNCVIASLETGNKNDCKNKMPFSMTIREIVMIEANESKLTETEKNSTADGEDKDMGTSATKSVGDPNTIMENAYLKGKDMASILFS